MESSNSLFAKAIILLVTIGLCKAWSDSRINCYSCNYNSINGTGNPYCASNNVAGAADILTEKGEVCYYALLKYEGETISAWRGAHDNLHTGMDILDAERGSSITLTFRKCKIDYCNDRNGSSYVKNSQITLSLAIIVGCSIVKMYF